MKLVTCRLEEETFVGVVNEALDAVYPIPGCRDLTALIASVRMHAQLYVLLYPQDGFVAPELYTRMIMEAAMTLCK